MHSTYARLELANGDAAYVSCLWIEQPVHYTPHRDLCIPSVLYDEAYYYSTSPVKAENCNQAVIEGDWFGFLRSTFEKQHEDCIYVLTVNHETNSAEFVIETSHGFTLFSARLKQYCKFDGLDQFFSQVEKVITEKEKRLSDCQKRLDTLQTTEHSVDALTQRVDLTTERTGPELVARLLAVYNELQLSK